MNWFHPHFVTGRANQSVFALVGVFGIVLARFFWLQVIGAHDLTLQSEENRLRRVVLRAPRGIMLDRNGIPLAENVPGFTVSILAGSETGLRETLVGISDLAGIDSAGVVDAIRRWREDPSDAVTVVRDAPREVVARLEERRIIFPGLLIQTEPKRIYPAGAVAAHVLGYLGEVSRTDLGDHRFPGARGGALVGITGLEYQYDARLRGVDGEDFIEVDALGRTVRTTGVGLRREPLQGDTLRTTIDLELQRYIVAVFGRQFGQDGRGAVMAIDPRNGAVLALYSAPSYDPNAFISAAGSAERNRLLRSPQQPLFNRAIQGRYPPASPWKLAVAALALDRGLITMDTKMQIPCTGGYQYGNRFFRCWNHEGHGDLTLLQAIQHSCDVYFYQLGIMLGLTPLLEGGTALGFGDLTGIDIPGEVRSLFPSSTAYFNRLYGRNGWTRAVTLNLAIGQGENDQTLVNMLRFYSMLAAGSAPVPFLVDSLPRGRRNYGLDEEILVNLRNSLAAVVEGGTAAGAQIANLRIAGKTGTAQNAHGADHGWFVAFAPVADPTILVGAVVEFAEHGSTVAPMVNCIIGRYLAGSDFVCPRRALRAAPPADSAPVPLLLLPDLPRNLTR